MANNEFNFSTCMTDGSLDGHQRSGQRATRKWLIIIAESKSTANAWIRKRRRESGQESTR